MKARLTQSIARVAVAVIVLVIGVTAGGMRYGARSGDIAQAPETVTATATLVPTSLPVQTSPPTSAPTQVPTVVPTLEPTISPTSTPATEEASGRGTFTVPANTTGSSIIVERGPTKGKFIALTFDAGEGRGYTERILDTLKAHGLHASFGTTAGWAKENPDLINRILDEGHLLFNHSATHASWTGASTGADPLTDAQREQEVLGAQQAVEDVAGWDMAPFWRPPYGDWDQDGQVVLARLGYDYTFYWTCDSLGWNGNTPDEIVQWCGPDTERGGPGAIILMHVSQQSDADALEGLIQAYEADGYTFVTMDRMIQP